VAPLLLLLLNARKAAMAYLETTRCIYHGVLNSGVPSAHCSKQYKRPLLPVSLSSQPRPIPTPLRMACASTRSEHRQVLAAPSIAARSLIIRVPMATIPPPTWPNRSSQAATSLSVASKPPPEYLVWKSICHGKREVQHQSFHCQR
jgi:hypothetical protein